MQKGKERGCHPVENVYRHLSLNVPTIHTTKVFRFWLANWRNYLVFLRSVRRLLVAACVVPSSPIFVILMKEAGLEN
jgi:hypothetical protein